jgi:hypothetical protein
VAEAEAATKRSAKTKKAAKAPAASRSEAPVDTTEVDAADDSSVVESAGPEAPLVDATEAEVLVADPAGAEGVVLQDPDDEADDSSNTKA